MITGRLCYHASLNPQTLGAGQWWIGTAGREGEPSGRQHTLQSPHKHLHRKGVHKVKMLLQMKVSYYNTGASLKMSVRINQTCPFGYNAWPLQDFVVLKKSFRFKYKCSSKISVAFLGKAKNNKAMAQISSSLYKPPSQPADRSDVDVLSDNWGLI